MRFLLIHQVFVSASEVGGTRHFELARHCVRQGHEFTIIASDLNYLSGQKAGSTKAWFSEEDIEGVRVIRAYTYAALHRSFTARMFSFLTFMISSMIAGFKVGPVDLVIGTSPPIFQAVSAWAIAALKRKPFLL